MEQMPNFSNNSENKEKTILNKIRDKASMVAKTMALLGVMNAGQKVEAKTNTESLDTELSHLSGSDKELPPIYVTDPDDSRLKEYNDSLRLYNLAIEKYEKDKKRLQDYANSSHGYLKYEEFESEYADNNYDAPITERVDGKLITKDSPFKSSIKPINIKEIHACNVNDKEPAPEGFMGCQSSIAVFYKKPIQPVILVEKTPKWFSIGNASDIFRNDLPSGTPIIHLDNDWLTYEEFEKYKKDHPEYKYSQKPDSVGRIYQAEAE